MSTSGSWICHSLRFLFWRAALLGVYCLPGPRVLGSSRMPVSGVFVYETERRRVCVYARDYVLACVRTY